ncbi:Calmodulin-like protein 7, partial [Cucurbita argyrosperma subsp. argyrosperma]
MDPTELKRVFQMFDRNGDGRITQKELSDSLENLGIFIPDKDLIQMIEKIDVNGDGCVDIDEFGELYQSIMDEKDEEEDMREAFNVFDQNGDGFITVDELRSVLASLGLKQGRTVEDCKKMITKVDVDGDGMVNYKEFKQMMKGGGFSALVSDTGRCASEDASPQGVDCEIPHRLERNESLLIRVPPDTGRCASEDAGPPEGGL